MKTKLVGVLLLLESCDNLQMSQDEMIGFVKNLLAILKDEKGGK